MGNVPRWFVHGTPGLPMAVIGFYNSSLYNFTKNLSLQGGDESQKATLALKSNEVVSTKRERQHHDGALH